MTELDKQSLITIAASLTNCTWYFDLNIHSISKHKSIALTANSWLPYGFLFIRRFYGGLKFELVFLLKCYIYTACREIDERLMVNIEQLLVDIFLLPSRANFNTTLCERVNEYVAYKYSTIVQGWWSTAFRVFIARYLWLHWSDAEFPFCRGTGINGNRVQPRPFCLNISQRVIYQAIVWNWRRFRQLITDDWACPLNYLSPLFHYTKRQRAFARLK